MRDHIDDLMRVAHGAVRKHLMGHLDKIAHPGIRPGTCQREIVARALVARTFVQRIANNPEHYAEDPKRIEHALYGEAWEWSLELSGMVPGTRRSGRPEEAVWVDQPENPRDEDGRLTGQSWFETPQVIWNSAARAEDDTDANEILARNELGTILRAAWPVTDYDERRGVVLAALEASSLYGPALAAHLQHKIELADHIDALTVQAGLEGRLLRGEITSAEYDRLHALMQDPDRLRRCPTCNRMFISQWGARSCDDHKRVAASIHRRVPEVQEVGSNH